MDKKLEQILPDDVHDITSAASAVISCADNFKFWYLHSEQHTREEEANLIHVIRNAEKYLSYIEKARGLT